MKRSITFHQLLKAAIERAQSRHGQATGSVLSLHTIARDVGIDLNILTLVVHGDAILDLTDLLPLLVYLGCDEKEQRFIFHLAELAHDSDAIAFLDPSTDEYALKLFMPPGDTDPGLDRITDEYSSSQ